MDRIMKERTSVGDAKRVFLEAIRPLERTEKAEITACVGRIISSSILAPRNVPHYRRSAMDGFAVRSADIIGESPTNPVMLQVSGEIEEGSSVQVSTGE